MTTTEPKTAWMHEKKQIISISPPLQSQVPANNSFTEIEPEYPLLSGATWSLTITIVSGIISFWFPGAFLITASAGLFWLNIVYSSDYSSERNDRNTFRTRRKKLAAEQRAAVQAKKDAVAYTHRQEVRRMIEKMPEYQAWRQQVLKRDAGADNDGIWLMKCINCGSTENLEVDHIASLDSIIKMYSINNEDEARTCEALWNVNNGRTLCKSCHDQTPTSMRRAFKLLSTENEL